MDYQNAGRSGEAANGGSKANDWHRVLGTLTWFHPILSDEWAG